MKTHSGKCEMQASIVWKYKPASTVDDARKVSCHAITVGLAYGSNGHEMQL